MIDEADCIIEGYLTHDLTTPAYTDFALPRLKALISIARAGRAES